MSTEQTSTPTPASANFEKLKAKLSELFELDKADLDFGIYRVLRARHKEIAEFLDKHLEKTVREALQSHHTVHQSNLDDDLRKAEQAAKDAGINPEQAPRVLEIREKLKAANDLDALADEVYSHLYTFFSRYYQEGDFLGLQRSTVHGREKYMIPYNGEEVKLVWANMDQYYIKSSELLRDYAFHVTPGEGTLLEAAANERFAVHFKLVEADTEKDNRKPSGKTTRAFALDEENAFVEDDAHTLTIRFRYREHAAERNLQDKLNADTEKTLADNLPPRWKAVLFAPDPTYQGKDRKDTRTLLQKHLRAYTARHQFDYFIHKDLGGFLRRELDFYIKNEVMYLDDIEDAAAPKAEEYLSKIRALRRCALPVVGMLEQLENFQKKLWLKKKFVVETRYCMTLDRVPESLYPEIAANEAQREEWVKLYAINEIKKDLAQPGYSEPLTVEFLKANPHLMLDTRHFGREFTLRLLSELSGELDDLLDGVCFHSENFQALQLMQERYREQVKCIYIDPPYNTGNDGFAYKDKYQHASWASMLFDRILVGRIFLRQDGALFASIDETEQPNMRQIFDSVLGIQNFVADMVWAAGRKNDSRLISVSHEYIIAYAKDRAYLFDSKVVWRQRKKGLDDIYAQYERLKREHGSDYPAISIELKRWYKELASSHPAKAHKHYCQVDKRGIYFAADISWPGGGGPKYEVLHPTTKKPVKIPARGWITPDPEKMNGWIADDRVHFGEDETAVPCLKSYLTDQEYQAPYSIFYQDGRAATKRLRDVLGTDQFGFPKDEFVLSELVAMLPGVNAIVLDYFSGSGTTGHAVINLNRENDGKRKYLLVEMGKYFETVLVPRLKKVVYSSDWKDGKPQNRNTGISHAFKIVRLEGYEDALNNLRLKRTPEQEAALQAAPEKARDQYLLGYFLDVESAGSASLLDLDQFRDPFAYQLKIATHSAGETVDTTVDLVETFNWLLGLKVKHIDAQKGFLTVTGEKRAGGRVLVIWRRLSDDPIADNKALEAFLGKIKVNPADTEFDYLYVNGSHTLTDPHNKVHLTEEAFQRLMFDAGSFESLE